MKKIFLVVAVLAVSSVGAFATQCSDMWALEDSGGSSWSDPALQAACPYQYSQQIWLGDAGGRYYGISLQCTDGSTRLVSDCVGDESTLPTTPVEGSAALSLTDAFLTGSGPYDAAATGYTGVAVALSSVVSAVTGAVSAVFDASAPVGQVTADALAGAPVLFVLGGVFAAAWLVWRLVRKAGRVSARRA